MASEVNEINDFVIFIEQHIDVLSKSQTKEQKQRKSEAADEIVEKFKTLTGKTLSHSSLLKKINNLKTRAKAAVNSGKPLSEWQTKILKICGPGLGPDLNNALLDTTPNDVIVQDGEKHGTPSKSGAEAEQILNEHKTEKTKLLSNDQLQRLVLLEQGKVLTLQEHRLERLVGEVVTEKDVEIDYVGWDGKNMI